MNTLILTNRGQQAFNSLKNDANYTLRIERVVFSNIAQNSSTLPYQNNLSGVLAEGILLTHFYSKDTAEKLNIICFIPRKAFPTQNYIVQSLGLFDQNNNLIGAVNVSPSGLYVGVVVKAVINLSLLNITKQHKKRILIKDFYNMSFDRIVLNQMAAFSDESCPFENYMYHFFEMTPKGEHISRGIFVRNLNNKYRIMIDKNTYLLLGERI